MAIYKEVFDLRGTTRQQEIAMQALESIKFPFERIKFPRGRAIIGWANLNGQTLATEHAQLDEGISPQNLTSERMHSGSHTPDGRQHEDGEHPAKDTDTEPLEGEIDGRKYVLGVFYPSTGNIYVDNALVNYPNLAQTTISAEVAHGVDEFLPLTDEQRKEIMTIAHHGDTTEHGHTWWEKVDYGSEYYTLLGETFMILFTYAYSDLPFEGAEDFIHPGHPEMGDDIRRVLGIQRTDYTESLYPEPAKEEPMPQEKPIIEEPVTPEAPAEIPVEEPVTPVEPTVPETPAPTEEPTVEPSAPEVEPVPAPEEDGSAAPTTDIPTDGVTTDEETTTGTTEPTPDIGDNTTGGDTTPVVPADNPNTGGGAVAPAIEDVEFVKYGKSKIYHLPSHYEKKKHGVAVDPENVANLRICKYCQKHLPLDILRNLV